MKSMRAPDEYSQSFLILFGTWSTLAYLLSSSISVAFPVFQMFVRVIQLNMIEPIEYMSDLLVGFFPCMSSGAIYPGVP